MRGVNQDLIRVDPLPYNCVRTQHPYCIFRRHDYDGRPSTTNYRQSRYFSGRPDRFYTISPNNTTSSLLDERCKKTCGGCYRSIYWELSWFSHHSCLGRHTDL